MPLFPSLSAGENITAVVALESVEYMFSEADDDVLVCVVLVDGELSGSEQFSLSLEPDTAFLHGEVNL